MKITYKEIILASLTTLVGIIAVIGLAAPLISYTGSRFVIIESGFTFMKFDSRALVESYNRYFVFIFGAFFFLQCLFGITTFLLGALSVFFPRLKKCARGFMIVCFIFISWYPLIGWMTAAMADLTAGSWTVWLPVSAVVIVGLARGVCNAIFEYKDIRSVSVKTLSRSCAGFLLALITLLALCIPVISTKSGENEANGFYWMKFGHSLLDNPNGVLGAGTMMFFAQTAFACVVACFSVFALFSPKCQKALAFLGGVCLLLLATDLIIGLLDARYFQSNGKDYYTLTFIPLIIGIFIYIAYFLLGLATDKKVFAYGKLEKKKDEILRTSEAETVGFLEEYYRLYREGTLTEDEYCIVKKRLLQNV